MVYEHQATMNMIVLAGLLMALGVVIDDNIMDVSHIPRGLRERDVEIFSSNAVDHPASVD